MATHSSILAWIIPWTGSLAGYHPGSHKELDMTKQMSTHIFCKEETLLSLSSFSFFLSSSSFLIVWCKLIFIQYIVIYSHHYPFWYSNFQLALVSFWCVPLSFWALGSLRCSKFSLHFPCSGLELAISPRSQPSLLSGNLNVTKYGPGFEREDWEKKFH